MKTYVETKSNGIVFPKKGSNKRALYEHQKRAMANLDIINRNSSYSTLIVIPTGGGMLVPGTNISSFTLDVPGEVLPIFDPVRDGVGHLDYRF